MELRAANVPMLRLRGLPFSVSVQDVLAFFAQHDVADRIVDGSNAAQLLLKANGRPSGQAIVQMRSREDADFARHALHNRFVSGRYIEVFAYGDATEAQTFESRSFQFSSDGKGLPSFPSSSTSGTPGPSEWSKSLWGFAPTLPAGLGDVSDCSWKDSNLPRVSNLPSTATDESWDPVYNFIGMPAPVSLRSVSPKSLPSSLPKGFTTSTETPPAPATEAGVLSRAGRQV